MADSSRQRMLMATSTLRDSFLIVVNDVFSFTMDCSSLVAILAIKTRGLTSLEMLTPKSFSSHRKYEESLTSKTSC